MKITETYLQFGNALTKRSKTRRLVAHHAATEECDAKRFIVGILVMVGQVVVIISLFVAIYV